MEVTMEATMKTECTKCGYEAEGRYCTRCGFLKKLSVDEGATAESRVEPHNQPIDSFIGTQDKQEPDSPDTVKGNGNHEARWEYKHVFLTAAKAVEHNDGSGKVTRIQAKSYKAEKMEEELQALGDSGWEVVSMEPHWLWERLNGNTSPETARPRAITGWYCTFKKKADLAAVTPGSSLDA
jgi:hypothetical protein